MAPLLLEQADVYSWYHITVTLKDVFLKLCVYVSVWGYAYVNSSTYGGEDPWFPENLSQRWLWSTPPAC